jgi:glycosyltransferase involved in cell wall biosynthesis
LKVSLKKNRFCADKVTGEDLAAAYASSDVFSFPSKSETFGQVVLEAQASGLPVIAFQAEGVCDIIQDGRTGWLAGIGSPDEEIANFERAILQAVASPERRMNASIEATRWAATWRWSEATEKAVDAYREVIYGDLWR